VGKAGVAAIVKQYKDLGVLLMRTKYFFGIMLALVLLTAFGGYALADNVSPQFNSQEIAEIGEQFNQNPVTEEDAQSFLTYTVYIFLVIPFYWGFRGVFKQERGRSLVFAICSSLVAGSLLM
jgi:hypothetical protein